MGPAHSNGGGHAEGGYLGSRLKTAYRILPLTQHCLSSHILVPLRMRTCGSHYNAGAHSTHTHTHMPSCSSQTPAHELQSRGRNPQPARALLSCTKTHCDLKGPVFSNNTERSYEKRAFFFLPVINKSSFDLMSVFWKHLLNIKLTVTTTYELLKGLPKMFEIEKKIYCL